MILRSILPKLREFRSGSRRLLPIGRFLTALANELRVLKVTTVYTAETRNLIDVVIGCGC
jgi:hypothetical protein